MNDSARQAQDSNPVMDTQPRSTDMSQTPTAGEALTTALQRGFAVVDRLKRTEARIDDVMSRLDSGLVRWAQRQRSGEAGSDAFVRAMPIRQPWPLDAVVRLHQQSRDLVAESGVMAPFRRVRRRTAEDRLESLELSALLTKEALSRVLQRGRTVRRRSALALGVLALSVAIAGVLMYRWQRTVHAATARAAAAERRASAIREGMAVLSGEPSSAAAPSPER